MFPPYRDGVFPGYWRDEQSDLPVCVEAYLKFCIGEGPHPTNYQIKRIVWFLQWFINAPCWEPDKEADYYDSAMAELGQLRERAKTLASVESVRRWTSECLEIGLDPW